MTTKLNTHIIELSNKIEDIYGNHYSEQYNYAINDIQSNTKLETTHIIVDLIDLTINDDYKQKQIFCLKKDVKELKEENKSLKIEVKELI